MDLLAAGLGGLAAGLVVAFLLVGRLVRGRPPRADRADRAARDESTGRLGSGPAHPARLAPEPEPAPPAEAVLGVLAVAVVLLDASDAVVLANPPAVALGVVRGGRLASEALRRLARDTRRDGVRRDVEAELPTHPRGQPAAVRVRAGRVAGAGYVALVVEDVTETRRVEAVRRDFVANVSHELKTPVGALSLLAEALQDASGDPTAVRRFAGRVSHESARLSRLVQELLDLSRLQGADPLPDPELVAVAAVVEEAVDRARLAAETRRIRIATGGEPGLAVLGVETQLVTAVVNLLDNAIAYSPEGTRVAVGYRSRGADVEIAVSDQGIGIPAADLERVFERFYRADPARSRATGGTGLGLAIVKHVATNHGGGVGVWSVEGSGSTFTLRLPRAELGSPAEVAGRAAAASPAASGPVVPAPPQEVRA